MGASYLTNQLPIQRIINKTASTALAIVTNIFLLGEFELLMSILLYGTPGRSRTCNLILRTDLLYPVELPRRVLIVS